METFFEEDGTWTELQRTCPLRVGRTDLFQPNTVSDSAAVKHRNTGLTVLAMRCGWCRCPAENSPTARHRLHAMHANAALVSICE